MRAFEIHAPKRLPVSPYAIPPAAPQEIRWRRWMVLALLPLLGFFRGKSGAEEPATPSAQESFEQWKRQVEATRPPTPSGFHDQWIG